MKAILIINPSSGKMKRKIPPKVKWTLDKSGRSLAGLFKPKTTEDDVTEEVKRSEESHAFNRTLFLYYVDFILSQDYWSMIF